MFPVGTSIQVTNPTHPQHGRAGVPMEPAAGTVADDVRASHKSFDGTHAPLEADKPVTMVKLDAGLVGGVMVNELTVAIADSDLRAL